MAVRKTPTSISHPGKIGEKPYADLVNEEVVEIWKKTPNWLSSVAGTNAITAVSNPTLDAYAQPMSFWLVPVADNTGGVTINIDALGVIDIKKPDGSALPAGELKTGRLLLIVFDGTDFRTFSGEGGAGSILPAPDMILHEQQPANVSAGTFTSGAWARRGINTVVRNQLSGASLGTAGDTGKITLQGGTYYIEWSVQANQVNGHQTRLRNTTDSSTIDTGSSERAINTVVGNSSSKGEAIITITSAKVLEIQHQCITTRATDGLGTPAGAFTAHEVYGSVKIWQLQTLDAVVSGRHGGAIAITYGYDDGISPGDPGDGILRFNNLTFTPGVSPTKLFVDVLSDDLTDYTITLDTIQGGQARVVKADDPTKWAIIAITGNTVQSGWRELDITLIQASSTSPFVDADPVLLAVGSPGADALITGTSTTSLLIGSGSKVFTTQADRQWSIGERLRAASLADVNNFMEGPITAYTGTTLTLAVDLTGGAGTLADWQIGISGEPGAMISIGAPVVDNAIPKYSGTTGNILEESGITIDDLNNIHSPSLGTEALPAITTGGDPDTGIWNPAANILAISAAGSEIARFGTALIRTLANTQIGNEAGGTFNANVLFTLSDQFPTITIRSGGTSKSAWLSDVSSGNMFFDSVGDVKFRDDVVAATEVMVIRNSGAVQFQDGAVGTPSISFLNDTDSGLWAKADNEVNLSSAGALAMQVASSHNNVSLGRLALDATMVNGNNNVCIGVQAGGNIVGSVASTGINNVCIGTSAGNALTDGNHNMCMGTQSLAVLTTGTDNVCVGRSSLTAITLAESNNVAIGSLAGAGMTTGSNNTLIGFAAGDNLTTNCDQNILIGYLVDAQVDAGSQQISIGNLIFGSKTATAKTATVNGMVGINVAVPERILHLLEIASDNTVRVPLRIEVQTTATPAIGLGGGIEFMLESSEAHFEIMGKLQTVLIDGTLGAERSSVALHVMEAGVTTQTFTVGGTATAVAAAVRNHNAASNFQIVNTNAGSSAVAQLQAATNNGTFSVFGSSTAAAGFAFFRWTGSGKMVFEHSQATNPGMMFQIGSGATFMTLESDNTAAIPIMALNNDPDTGWFQSAANIIDWTTGGVARQAITADKFDALKSANAASIDIETASQLLTALSGASVVTSGLIPAGAMLLGVVVRVTTLITGAT